MAHAVNCQFYSKVGACKNGDLCPDPHTKPTRSRTLLFSNMYQPPDKISPGVNTKGEPLSPRQIRMELLRSMLDDVHVDAMGQPLSHDKIRDHLEDFYETLYTELSKYGKIERMHICGNLAYHMAGNVYVRFIEEEHAADALQKLRGSLYEGHRIIVDFSPVTSFTEAACHLYERDEESNCDRDGRCNYMHRRRISHRFLQKLNEDLHAGNGHRNNDDSPPEGGKKKRKLGRRAHCENHSESDEEMIRKMRTSNG